MALLAVLLASCATEPPEPESLADGLGNVTSAGRSDIALMRSDERRVDHLTLFGQERPYLGFKTGEQWAQAFTGLPDEPGAKLRIDDARLVNTFINAGFQARIRYSVNATLMVSDREIPLHTEAAQTYVYDQATALRAVVSSAVRQMSDQAGAALQQQALGTTTRTADATADKLRVLTKLLKDGAVTQQEYDASRRRILDAL